MKQITCAIALICTFMMSSLAIPVTALAALPPHGGSPSGGGGCSTNNGALPSLWKGLNCDAQGNVQIKSAQDALKILANAIQLGIALAGALGVIFIIIGGIQYTISAGDSKRVATAKSTITYAVGGLLLCISAYAIVQFVSQGF